MSRNKESSHDERTTCRSTAWLLLYLRFIGLVALLAFAAAVMPSKWIVEIGEELGFEPFPESPLLFYLARNLSALYGFVGIAMLLIASDISRYRPLIVPLAIGTFSFGVLQLMIDSLATMPKWWTIGEGVSTMIGGVIMLWLARRGHAESCLASESP